MSDDQQKDIFIESLYREHYMDLKRYSYHYFRNDPKFTPYIEDCIQETFTKAMSNYRKLLTSPNVTGWLVKTCRNELCECLRKHMRYRKHFEGCISVEVESAAAAHDDLDRWIRRHDAEDDIRRIYQALSPLEQVIFDDYYAHDRSLKETAAKHSTTENAVHCGAKRIRKKAESLIKKNFTFLF